MARIASVLGAVAILACASAYATPSAPAAAPSGSSSGSGSSGNTPWKPVVGVREVNAFNLLSSSSVFGKIIRAGCTGSSKSSFGQYGCPNLGIVEMDSIAIGNEEQQADLVAMVVATSALPAAVMAYFEIGSNFNLTYAGYVWCALRACAWLHASLATCAQRGVVGVLLAGTCIAPAPTATR